MIVVATPAVALTALTAMILRESISRRLSMSNEVKVVDLSDGAS